MIFIRGNRLLTKIAMYPSKRIFPSTFISLKIAIHKMEKNIFNSTMLDIGANIGNHSLFFSNYFAKCISFEPNPRTFSVLEINSRLVENIIPMNIGLSDKKGEVELKCFSGYNVLTSMVDIPHDIPSTTATGQVTTGDYNHISIHLLNCFKYGHSNFI